MAAAGTPSCVVRKRRKCEPLLHLFQPEWVSEQRCRYLRRDGERQGHALFVSNGADLPTRRCCQQTYPAFHFSLTSISDCCATLRRESGTDSISMRPASALLKSRMSSTTACSRREGGSAEKDWDG